eukprot:Sspe_Gene.84331::Locus_55354_Transcript_1_1_Confidence_1.000_Length_1178::g.84331::m.84331
MHPFLIVFIAAVGVLACVALYAYARTLRYRWREQHESKSHMICLLDVENGPPISPSSSVAEAGLDLNQEGVPYKVCHNYMMGGLLSLTDKYPKMASFDIYIMRLRYVDDVFHGRRQPWNRAYKSAKMIFGSGPRQLAVRGAIHMEHSVLYREKGIERVSRGRVHNGDELLHLLGYGLLDGKSTFFTYVILGDGAWHFSVTGASVVRDNLSKHAVHANASREVVYAGEFHISNGCLVVDNSSGTYSPRKDDLPLVKQLLETNFPGLRVKYLDWQDPALQQAVLNCPTRCPPALRSARLSPPSTPDGPGVTFNSLSSS